MACNIEKIGENNACVCDTLEEARDCASEQDRPNASGLVAVANFEEDVAGGVWDGIYGLGMSFGDVARYVTGTYAQSGERQPWRRIGRNLNLENWVHPELVVNAADVAGSCFFGGVDMVLGHAPNYIFNDVLGMDIKYFHPQPRTVREFVAEMTSVGLMFAGARAVKGLKAGQPGKFQPVEVAETAPVKAYQPVFEPRLAASSAEAGFIDVTWLAKLVERLKKSSSAAKDVAEICKDKGNEVTHRLLDENPELLSRKSLSQMIDAGGEMSEVPKALVAYGLKNPGFARRILHALVKKAETNKFAADALDDLGFIAKNANLLSNNDIATLIRAMRKNGNGTSALMQIVLQRPELFPQVMSNMIEAARSNKSMIGAIETLAKKAAEHFTGEQVSSIIDLAKINAEACHTIFELAYKKPGLFTAENVAVMIDGLKNDLFHSGLARLAASRPALFTPEHVTAVLDGLKARREHWPTAKFPIKMFENLARSKTRVLTPDHISAFIEELRTIKETQSRFGYENALKQFINLAKENPDLFDGNISRLIDAAKAGVDISDVTNELVWRKKDLFTAEDFHRMAKFERKSPRQTFKEPLDTLATTKPEFITDDYIKLQLERSETFHDGIGQRHARWLASIAQKRSDLSVRIVSGIIRIYSKNPDVASVLNDLAWNKPDLFTSEHIPGLMRIAKKEPSLAGTFNELAGYINRKAVNK